jgi:tetratricopeptide (TPR) repeat protein
MGIFSACGQPEKKEEKKNTVVPPKSQEKTVQKQKLQSLDSLVPPPSPDNNMNVAMNAYNQGLKLYQEGDLEGALVQFKSSLANYPENSNACHYLGRIYYDLGQKGLSLAYYEDAVRFNLNDTVSMLGIGQVYFDMGDLVNAKEYYDMTIENAPFYGLAYYNRGTMLGMQKQYHSALNDLNKSIELDPSNANAFLNRGLAHFFLKDMEKACEDWNQAADMGLAKGIEAVEIYCKN